MKTFLYACLVLPVLMASSVSANSDDGECINISAHSDYAKPGQDVSWSEIDVYKVIEVCNKTVEQSNDYRNYYGLGRAFNKKYTETKLEPDFIKAVKAYDESFNLGYANSAWAIAKLYLLKKDWSSADKWLDKGIDKNSLNAFNLKALLLFDTDYDYPNRDIDKAIDLYKRSLDSPIRYENKESLSLLNYNLGRIYYYDKYQRQNFQLAKKHFNKASIFGDSHAAFLLGYMYEQGKGIPKDNKKAVTYYLRAKTLGEENKALDQNIIQNAWSVWMQDQEAYQYYDIAVNTLRELAKKDNQEAKKFLYAQKIGISSDEAKLDSATVNMMGKVYIDRAMRESEVSDMDTLNDNRAKVRKTIENYADLMMDNALYYNVIDYFEKNSTIQYSVTRQLNEYYLANIYLRLYIDFRHEDDAVKALANAVKVRDETTLKTVIAGIEAFAPKDLNINTLLDKSSVVLKDNKVETFMAKFNDTVKAGASERAIYYLDYLLVDINSQRNQDGASMLHMAVWYGDLALTQKLIEKGADINLKDHDGDTPLAYAIHKKNIELITYLSAQGGKN